MKLINNLLLKNDLTRIKWIKCDIPWDNTSLLHGRDVISYCSRFIDHNIIKTEKANINEIDIRKLSGLSNTNTDISELELKYFNQLTNDFKKIACESRDNFLRNTKWLNDKKASWLCCEQKWDGRIFVLNSDGSHHIAAVYVQAKKQNLEYLLKCDYVYKQIDSEYFHKLRTISDWFYVDNDNLNEFNNIILNYKFTRDVNPIRYPIDKQHLCICKTKLGLELITYLKKNNCLCLFDEIEKWVD